MMSSSIFTSRAQKVSMKLIMVTLTTPRHHIYTTALCAGAGATYCCYRASLFWSRSSWPGRRCRPPWPRRTRCTCPWGARPGGGWRGSSRAGCIWSEAVRAALEPGESCSLYHRVGEVVQHGLLAGRHPLVQQLQHRVRPQRGHHLGVDTVRASYRAGQRKLELARAG